MLVFDERETFSHHYTTIAPPKQSYSKWLLEKMKSNTKFLVIKLLYKHKRKYRKKKGMYMYSTLYTLKNKLYVPLLWRLAISSSLLLTLLLTGSLCFILLCRCLLLLLPFSRDILSLLIHNILFQIKLFKTKTCNIFGQL